MNYDRWEQWIKKAAGLKEKYSNKKMELIKNLNMLKPKLFRYYNYQESKAKLAELKRIIDLQELLYMRFINGSQVFLDSVDKENKHFLEKFFHEGKRLIAMVQLEKKNLDDLRDNISTKELIKIHKNVLKEYEGESSETRDIISSVKNLYARAQFLMADQNKLKIGAAFVYITACVAIMFGETGLEAFRFMSMSARHYLDR
jgi:hypothetical protein